VDFEHDAGQHRVDQLAWQKIATIRAKPTSTRTWLTCKTPNRPRGKPETIPGWKPEATSLHWWNFIQSVRTREKPVSDVEFALKVQAALCMAMLSLRKQRVATFDPVARRTGR
jgi:hypothetical protein